MLITFYSFSG